MTHKLTWMASCPRHERQAMGRRAAEVVDEWGPDRFAAGHARRRSTWRPRIGANASERVLLKGVR